MWHKYRWGSFVRAHLLITVVHWLFHPFSDEIDEVTYDNKIKKAFSESLEDGICKGKEKIKKINQALESTKLEKENAEAEVAKISQRFSDIKEEIHHFQVMEKMEDEIQQVMKSAFFLSWNSTFLTF